MLKKQSFLLLLLLVAVIFLTSCADKRGGILRYRVDGISKVWPNEPDIPRYKYIGQLTGENNFYKESKKDGFFMRFVKWFVGLNTREPERVFLRRPQSGFVDEKRKRIYVTDISRQAVFVFDDEEGDLVIWEKADPVDGSNFLAPIGIAPGKDGEVYVADADLGVVVKLSSDGVPIMQFGKGILKRPTGLARDARFGRIYVSDTHAHNIKIFDDSGELLDVIGQRGIRAGEFNFPTFISYKKNRLYVTDSMNARVQIFDQDGDFISKFGKRSLNLGDFLRPKGVAVDNNGNIYVVESYYDYLLVYNNDGEFLLPVGGTGSGIGEFYLPAGVWTDSLNRVYVADMFNGRIMIFQYLDHNPGKSPDTSPSKDAGRLDKPG